MIFFSFLSGKIILSGTSFVYFRQRVRKQPKQLKTNNFLLFHFPITAEASPPPAASSLLHSAARHFSIQQRYLYPNRLSILFYKTVYESWNCFIHLRPIAQYLRRVSHSTNRFTPYYIYSTKYIRICQPPKGSKSIAAALHLTAKRPITSIFKPF